MRSTQNFARIQLFALLAFALTAVASAQSAQPITAAGQWTWMSGSSTLGSYCLYPSIFCGQLGVYGQLGTPAQGNVPGSRTSASTWTDSNGHLWFFGGSGYDSVGNLGVLNDLWEFDPLKNEWIWMSGSKIVPFSSNGSGGMPGVYGTLGTPTAFTVPGGRWGSVSWTDRNGNFWFFGGYGADSNDNQGFLNDLWEFNPSAGEWAWISGGDTVPTAEGQPGVYGPIGVFSAANTPGGRRESTTWTDSSGRLWLFGGGTVMTPVETPAISMIFGSSTLPRTNGHGWEEATPCRQPATDLAVSQASTAR